MMIPDEALRRHYQKTGVERLHKLQMGLLTLEQEPGNQASLEQLQQDLQALNSDSQDLGVTVVADLTQQLAAIINAIQHQVVTFTFEVSDRLYQGLHATGQLLHEVTTGEPSDIELRDITDLLAEVLSDQPAWDLPPPSSPLYIDDDELRDIYSTTCEARLQALEGNLRQLVTGTSGTTIDPAVLESMRQETHSLKGDSRAVGLDTVADLVQTIEDIVKDIQGQPAQLPPTVMDGLIAGFTGIRQLIQEAVSGQPSGIAIAPVQAQLQAIAAAVAGCPQPDVAKPAATVLSTPSLMEDVELREIYRTTSEERLHQLETGLLNLEKHPQDEATLAALLREAHSLKGDSGATGVGTVETLVHALEDVLIRIQRQDLALESTVSDSLYQGLDTIRQLVQAAVTGQAAPVNPDDMLARLQKIATHPRPQEGPATLPSPSPPPPQTAEESTTMGPPPPVQPEDTPSRLDSVRVPARALDALMAQVEELAVTRIQIAQTAAQTQQLMTLWEDWRTRPHHQLGQDSTAPSYDEQLETLLLGLHATVEDNSSKLMAIAEALRSQVRQLQLLPLSILFQPLPRLVRDLARHQSKDVSLIVEGEEIRADKRLLEGIKDSLLHLVRNAIDHGIETTEERLAAGKPATATLRVTARQTALSLILTVSDDGRGLDIEHIKATALQRGLYRQSDLEAMTVSQLQQLILAPGFSTRTLITEISGRGVGLDVLRTQVEQLKGQIHIASTPGQGCTFTLHLSTALSTVNVVLVEAQGIPLALPVECLHRLLQVPTTAMTSTDGSTTIDLDGTPVPVADLVDVLELPNSPTFPRVARPSPVNGYRSCVLLKVGEEQGGFLVDRLIDQQEVVSKPLGAFLKRVRNVTGATTLGTGEVCMILNPPDLMKSLHRRPFTRAGAPQQRADNRKPILLLVEDSPPVRIQEKRLFERAGYEVVTANHGLEGYNKLKHHSVDAVVSDVEMPYLDGFSLVAEIRQHREYDTLPVILVTTLDSEADRQRGAEAGANAYIIKGRFNQEVLLETVARLI